MSAEKATVLAIGHGHIDVQWPWGRQEALDEARSTFRSALNRMEETEGFKFSASSTLYYDYVKRTDRKMFQEIQERVTEGRWEIVGGKYVEPDCNIPSGESQLRQYLHGQRFFYDNFGRITKVGFEPDGFGHNAETAKLARHAGIEYFTFMRPSRDEMGLPHGPFMLESSDGSQLLTARIPFDYSQQAKTMEKHLERIIDQHDGESTNMLMFYGVGNHGGGPTKENIREIQRLQDKYADRIDLRFGTLQEYFTAVEQEDIFLPTIRGELQAHAVGCYSAGAKMKQTNRRAENNLLVAEKMRSLAGISDRSERLTEIGKTIAEHQFHDTAGATTSPPVHEESINAVAGAAKEAKTLAEEALGRLAAHIKIEHIDNVQPILIANPNTWQSKIPIETEVQSLRKGARLVDNQGREIPVQEIRSNTELNGRHRIAFFADLPSLGYKTYHLINKESEINAPEPMQATDTQMENDRYLIGLDGQTGVITRLCHKKSGSELFKKNGGMVIHDGSDTWSHGIYFFKDKDSQFQAIQPPKLIEHGEVKSTIRIKSSYGKSTMTQDITMYNDHDGIHVDTTLNWQEQQKLLKLPFPIDLYHRENTYEIPHGTIQRPSDGREVPGQSWVDISGTHRVTKEQLGVAIINDGKYSFDVDVDTLSMTIVRSPVHIHHEPREIDPEKNYEYMDQGPHKFSYMILPHEGDWKKAGVAQKAAEFNQPPLSLITSGNEKGTLPQEDSFAEVGADNVMMTVVKRAEDPNEEAYVVRLNEMHHKTTKTTITINGREIPITIGASKLKSLKIPFNPKAPIFETDATELTKITFK